MGVAVSVEMISNIRIVIENLELWEASDDFSNVVLVSECLLEVGQMLVDADVTVVLVRPAELEQFARNIAYDHRMN